MPQTLDEVGGAHIDVNSVGDTTATQWFVIVALPAQRQPTAMFLTTDAGRAWARVNF